MQSYSPRPGEEEAKSIKKTFEWKNRLRTIENDLQKIQDNIKLSEDKRGFFRKYDVSYDPEYEIKKLEEIVTTERSQSSPTAPPSSRVHRALSEISKRLDEPLDTGSGSLDKSIRNDWAAFEKFETERREFVEASYRRYRLGPFTGPFEPVDDSPAPPSSATPPSVPDHATPRQTTPSLPPATSEEDRRDYMSRLVSSKSKDQHAACRTLSEGQPVEVCYYGIHFPGHILQRNFGHGTVRVKFADGTTNDFPISSIILS
jgi:hypothetical protein